MPEVIVLSDFDGTIATRDVSETILDNFAKEDWRAICDGVANSSRQYWNLVLALLQIEEPALREYVLTNFQIDPAFPQFVTLCERQGWQLQIVSDGFDYYIKLLLGQANLLYLPFTANRIEFRGQDIVCEFPFASPVGSKCTRCGNCKQARLKRYKRPDNIVVYIGDGDSDCCPAKKADIVFAKDRLAAYCEASGIAYYPFTGFAEIIKQLPQLLAERSAF